VAYLLRRLVRHVADEATVPIDGAYGNKISRPSGRLPEASATGVFAKECVTAIWLTSIASILSFGSRLAP
jgi:hypothetical protein